mgnify:CR=1 FL=1
MQFQQTIKRRVLCQGIGIHSGQPAKLVLEPAPANAGIVFIRRDLPGAPMIAARASRVLDSRLATTLGNNGAYVATVEHLLAALAGLGIDNVRVEVFGPELPILDGSAAPFVALLQQAGLKTLRWPRAFFQLREPVEVRDGDKWLRVEPAAVTSISYQIDFPHPAVGRQELTWTPQPQAFGREIAPARTFGFLKDVQRLQQQGQALGGSLANAIVLDDQGVLNPEGLRFPDEFVRHKILDLIGDLALLGWPLLGRIQVYKGSHALHHQFMQTLLADQSRWRLWVPPVPLPSPSDSRLPRFTRTRLALA